MSHEIHSGADSVGECLRSVMLPSGSSAPTESGLVRETAIASAPAKGRKEAPTRGKVKESIA